MCGLLTFDSCQEDEDVVNPPYSPENIDGLWVEMCDIDQTIVPHIEISGSTLKYCDADVEKHDYTSSNGWSATHTIRPRNWMTIAPKDSIDL